MEKDGTVCLVVRLLAFVANLKMYRRVLPIHPNEHIMRKDSAYLSNLKCYTETFYLSTHFGVLYGKLQSNKLLTLRLSLKTVLRVIC